MLWAYLALGAVWLGGAFAISLGAVITHHVSIDSSGGLNSLDYPGGSDAWWGGVQAVFFPAVAVLAGVARRAGAELPAFVRERRLQLKWLLSGATVFIAPGSARCGSAIRPACWKVVNALAFVGLLALPVSIGSGS